MASLVEQGVEVGSSIRLRGVRVHNLRDIDVDIPRDRLVVLTGVSGSGKSSLAFDTIHAEGRRRYVEGLSTYARQFLDQIERPDVDLIDGLPPTVAIDQKTGSANPRSTVATVTEAWDYLRLLYARTGAPHCPKCGKPILRQAPEQVVDLVLGLGEGTKLLVLAPLIRGRKGQHLETFRAIREAGLMRARVDGAVVEVDAEPPKLVKTKVHDIEAVVDRLVVREGIRARVAESVDRALKLGEGTLVLTIQKGDAWEDRIASTRYACTGCGTGLAEIEPRTFSFNSPHGACPDCGGLGSFRRFDPDLVVPDRGKSLEGGAVVAWEALPTSARQAARDNPALGSFLQKHHLAVSTPLSDWSEPSLGSFFLGESKGYSGILATLEQDFAVAKTDARRSALDTFRSEVTCPSCQGARLRPEARAVTLGGRSLPALAALNVDQARAFLASLRFEPELDRVGPPLVAEVDARLAFLGRVGLNYLTLDRGADTLSGGELQRVRLATQIGSGLVGVCYVLDEPTTGLHPRDTGRLLASLADLRDRGNSVIVVEHDEATIRAADWLIDLGPGAGPDGGLVVAQGPPDALIESGESSTARHLRGETPAPAGSPGRLAKSPGRITIRGAAEHNLKGVTASIPLGTLTCVTGVSGSGKSTLVHDILARTALRRLEQKGPRPGAHEGVDGLEAVDKLIVIDQSPIGRGPRSTPSTFTGVFDEIRQVFARTREAKVRGYAASRFSFNVKGGRCETCQGQGVRKIEMNFLPDLYVRCETCEGLRYNPQTLECRFKGRSIGDVLQMRVDDARTLFENVPRVARSLESLREAGLGYVALGQSSTTLSGGEAQRVKLAAELGRVATGRTLYILDEPTTGLHFSDVAALMVVLHRLADLGNTLVVIEHNLDVIRTADWVIDLGPEGGDKGGRLMAEGPPGVIAETPASETGRWLMRVDNRNKS
ncbi:excinuclease ABC subunit UvrA [Tundrisphaera lichenicola]|uniref:excinuclease ABC subunit UvrA n=1 Tax=Tundrisphaera lichenicola TaxID=2029860 RepID=UPI003EB7CE32